MAMVAAGPRLGMVGRIDPSMTNSPSIPLTRQYLSTTACLSRSFPKGAVPHRCCDVDHRGPPKRRPYSSDTRRTPSRKRSISAVSLSYLRSM
ncbi:Uncharacterised protein [Mycobacteroides abscessus subsp. abscessus]|nr:Uncharacterised protein [Mycobacteroides abscessus subsp. abscessus]